MKKRPPLDQSSSRMDRIFARDSDEADSWPGLWILDYLAPVPIENSLSVFSRLCSPPLAPV